MTIDFNVLSSLMEDRFGGDLDDTCVVSMKRNKMCQNETKFSEETMEPDDFGACRRHSMILSVEHLDAHSCFLHYCEQRLAAEQITRADNEKPRARSTNTAAKTS